MDITTTDSTTETLLKKQYDWSNEDFNSHVQYLTRLVHQLYHSQGEAQAEANRQLTSFQSSPSTWELCWHLLTPSPVNTVEMKFFAANTLNIKINQSWSRMDEDWLKTTLRSKLVETLLLCASDPNTNKVVVERLSIALATYTVRAIGTFWPDAIEDILQIFQTQNLQVTIEPARIVSILLGVLKFIPEEYSNLISNKDQCIKSSAAINKSTPAVLNFLLNLLTADQSIVPVDSKRLVLNCITSWSNNSMCSVFELDNGQQIVGVIFDMLGVEDLCKAACSALCAIYGRSRKAIKSPLLGVNKLGKLEPLLDKYTREENTEACVEIYELLICFAEQNSRLLLQVIADQIPLGSVEEDPKPNIYKILTMILRCTAAPGLFPVEENYSDKSFSFWYTFQEDIGTSEPELITMYRNLFTPLISSVLEILLKKVQYPEEYAHSQVWSEDERETFRCYRQDIGDTLNSCYPVLRENMLAKLYDEFNHGINHLAANIGHPENKPWQRLEASLYGFRAISELVPYDEEVYLKNVFSSLRNIPMLQCDSNALYCTAAEMVASYTEWIYDHNETVLEPLLDILFTGIHSDDKAVTLMATISLKDVTYECQAILKPLGPKILASCLPTVDPKFGLRSRERSRIMCAIGHTLAIMPHDEIMAYLNTLLAPIMSQINDVIIKHQTGQSDQAQRKIIIDRLMMMSCLMESLNPTQIHEPISDDDDEYRESVIRIPLASHGGPIQPVFHILQQLLPALAQIGMLYPGDEEVLKAIGDCIKRSARTLQEDLRPLVNNVLQLIVTIYDPSNNPFILENLHAVYTEFRNCKQLQSSLRAALYEVCNRSLALCQIEPIRNITYTIEQLFKFLQHVLRKASNLYRPDDSIGITLDLNAIFKCAIASLSLPENRTVTEVCGFLSGFVTKSPGIENFAMVVKGNISELFAQLMLVVGGAYSTPRNLMDYIADVIISLVDNYRQDFNVYVRVTIEKDNFPTGFISKNQKSILLSQIMRESKNKRKCREICQEFCLIARNLKA